MLLLSLTVTEMNQMAALFEIIFLCQTLFTTQLYLLFPDKLQHTQYTNSNVHDQCLDYFTKFPTIA